MDLTWIACACVIGLSGLEIPEINIIGSHIDVRIIAVSKYRSIVSVGLHDTKPRIGFTVFLVDDRASIEIIAVNAVCDWFVCITGKNGLRRTGCRIILIEITVGLCSIVVKILSKRAAVEDIIRKYLFALFAVDLYPVKRGGILVIIVQVINIITEKGGVDAWIFVQDSRLAATSFYPAETVIVKGKHRKINGGTVIVSYIIDIIVVGIDVHGGIVVQLADIRAICIHGIKPAAVIRIGKKYGAVAFAEQPSIIEISGSVAVYISIVVMKFVLPDIKKCSGKD